MVFTLNQWLRFFPTESRAEILVLCIQDHSLSSPINRGEGKGYENNKKNSFFPSFHHIFLSLLSLFVVAFNHHHCHRWHDHHPLHHTSPSPPIVSPFSFTAASTINVVIDTIKRLMSSPKCRSVEVINNPARPGSNHREVNYINYKQ